LLVAGAALAELLPNKPLHAFADQPRFHFFVEVFVERIIAAEKARVEKRRAHLHIDGGQARAFRDPSRRMADLQRRVPKGVKQFFGERFDERRNLPAVEKQQIDIRLRVEFAAPVAALRDQSKTATRRGKLLGVLRADGREKMPNQMIHDRGPGRGDLQPACAAAMSVKQGPPAMIDVLARRAFQVMIILHLLEQRERYGDGVHGSMFSKGSWR
jgi:hypothetical protein